MVIFSASERYIIKTDNSILCGREHLSLPHPPWFNFYTPRRIRLLFSPFNSVGHCSWRQNALNSVCGITNNRLASITDYVGNESVFSLVALNETLEFNYSDFHTRLIVYSFFDPASQSRRKLSLLPYFCYPQVCCLKQHKCNALYTKRCLFWSCLHRYPEYDYPFFSPALHPAHVLSFSPFL